ncbi:hypothetical protein [Bacillus sp. C1]
MFKRLRNFITSFELIIGFNFILMIVALGGAIFSVYVKEYTLAISSSSVVAASISGIIAARVIKSQKDKERPYLTLVLNYDRYDIVQIGVKNSGNTLAVIEKVEADNNIKLHHGQVMFDIIKGLPIQPNETVAYPLTILNDSFADRKSSYTTNGEIVYKDLTGKTYKNKFMINLEPTGATLAYPNEQLKRDYQLQKIPQALDKIAESLDKVYKM